MDFLMVFVTAIAGGMAYLSSKLIAQKLYTDQTCLNVLVRLAIGTAIIVCAMNFLLHFLSGWSAAWITFIGLAVASYFGCKRNWAVLQNKAIFENRAEKLAISIFVLSVSLGLWRVFSIFKLGHLTAFEGTGNHDELWYVIVARGLLHHSLNSLYSNDPLFPAVAAARVNLQLLPRFGSESLVTFITAISGGTIPKVYTLQFVWASILLMGTSALGLLTYKCWTSKRFLVAVTVIAISPVTLFIYGNQNFATCFGLAFLGAQYWLLRQGLEVLEVPEGRSEIFISGLFLAALTATYPELLAIAVPASIVLSIQSVLRHKATHIQEILFRLLLLLLVAGFSAPFAFFDAIKVLVTTSQAALGQNIFLPELFSSINIGNLALTLVTFATQIIQTYFGSFGTGIASAIIWLTLFVVPKRVFSETLGLLVGCAIVLCTFWLKNYGYGGMKAIEFFALPISMLVAASIAQGLPGLNKSKELVKSTSNSLASVNIYKLGKPLIAIAAVTIICGVSLARSAHYYKVAMSANLSQDLLDLGRARTYFKPGDILYVDQSLGSQPFMESRWIAYILSDVPMVMAPDLHQGGYIYNLESAYEKYFPKITYVLRAIPSSGKLSPKAIFNNNQFEILPISSVNALYGKGFYGDEGWGRWMGQDGDIDVFGSCARTLTVNVLGVFPNASRSAGINVTTSSQKEVHIDLIGGHGTFQVPLAGLDHEVVHIRALAAAESPESLGMSADSRKLTFSFGKVEVEKAKGCSN